MFKSLQIRYKFLVSYSLLFVVTSLLLSGVIYAFVRSTIEAGVERELQQTTGMILNMVKTSAGASIRNHLRAIAEKNRDIAGYYHRLALSGILTPEEAKQKAGAVMLSQTIGTSGYVCCLDSSGIMAIHPEQDIVGSDVSGHAFAREQIRMKQGYLEYEWKNPGEERPRPKALYMAYFEPWDWIISASTYRNEFRQLVNVDDFRDSILSITFGRTGYSFVLDLEGRPVIHPGFQGGNGAPGQAMQEKDIREMLEKRRGRVLYDRQRPGGSENRQELVIFNSLPEYGWIVASSSCPDEFYGPLKTIRNVIAGAFVLSLLLVLPITFTISSSITNPLHKLMAHFDRGVSGDFTARMAIESRDEVGQLTQYFNRFMGQLEAYHRNLRDEMEVRRVAEEARLETQARFRSAMEAAPDPIVIYDMDGRVIFLNPEFTTVFGWTLDECRGRKLDHFVPGENWDETTMMIERILSGKPIRNVETRRLTRANTLLCVSISSSTYRDSGGRLAGTVIILRDITASKNLEKRVMDISNMERQAIGQDLHDDLCPHLIGIQGLATVLELNLADHGPEDHDGDRVMAARITGLITEAITKTRALARGLCPVHLVSHGLYSALNELAGQMGESSAADICFTGDDTIVIDDNTIATHLYYIAREAIANAIRHSGAAHIRVRLDQPAPGGIRMRVNDNGRGMAGNADGNTAGGGIGLRIMHHRAAMINARLEIKALEMQGTTVELTLQEPAGTARGDSASD